VVLSLRGVVVFSGLYALALTGEGIAAIGIHITLDALPIGSLSENATPKPLEKKSGLAKGLVTG